MTGYKDGRSTLQINCKNISTQFDFAHGIALKYNQHFRREKEKKEGKARNNL